MDRKPAPMKPKTAKDSMACTVLFMLSGFDGTRQTFKLRQFNLQNPDEAAEHKLQVASNILDFYQLDQTYDEIIGRCRWLSFKSNHPNDWMKLARGEGGIHWRRLPGVCEICQIPAKICQIPERYAERHGWFNDISYTQEPGLCTTTYTRWLIEVNQMFGYLDFDFNRPTGWKIIDDHLKYLGFL